MTIRELGDPLANLDPEQREVALFPGHCLAVACPGAGKTGTLAAKAAHLLLQGYRVAAVTFTRESALELRHRIVTLSGPSSKPRLLVGTFHSIDMLMAFPGRNSEYGRAILQDMKSEFTSPWNIVKEGVRRSYIIRAIQAVGIKNMDLNVASNWIEVCKEMPDHKNAEPEILEMVSVYGDLLLKAKQIDFQDILLLTNKALKEKTITPLPIDFLLVDEFQDADEAQSIWTEIHGRSGAAVTAVGDDDQSIYAFRRALGFEGMDRFAQRFGAHRVLLARNYRSHSEILDVASNLIAKNIIRIDKQMVSHKGAGGTVVWETFANRALEANAIAEEAFVAQGKNVDFAVIAQTNRELDEPERALLDRGIPYKRTDGSSIFDCPEVQVYAALLRTLIKVKSNDVDLVLGWAGMSPEDCLEVRALFGSRILVGGKNDFASSKLSDAGIDIWRSFAKKHNEWRVLYEKQLYKMLNSGIHEWLLETLLKPNRPKLVDVAFSMFEVGSDTLEVRLESIKAAEERHKRKDSDPEAWFVTLVTCHSSKGLQYDWVWIVGLEDGGFPNDKSSLEEQRRLMFVAMTRAKNILWMSCTTDKKPSVFVKESGVI